MISHRTRRRLVCVVAALVVASCGESGQAPTRPVEVIYYVTGPSGSQFAVGAIKPANALHNLSGRTFQTPHFFVLENAFQFPDPTQEICASFRNSETSPAPIVVSFFTGMQLQRSLDLPPGMCTTLPLGIITDCSTPTTNPCPEQVPQQNGPEVRFELCRNPLSGDCLSAELTPPPNIPFNANLGDIRATNVTACNVTPISFLPCTTPATFFLEDAQETATGAFIKVPPAEPGTVLRGELYVNGELGDVDVTSSEVVVTNQLGN